VSVRLRSEPHVVGRLGSGMQVSASFQIIPRAMSRLGLGSEPHVVGRLGSGLGMYRIAIFKIRLEPNNTGYQTNYPAGTGTGTGYLDTRCIIANFLVYFVVRIKM